MLKRLKRIFTNGGTTPNQVPDSIPHGQHDIVPGDISKGARQVVEVLEQAGYQAFLVGGCVRDLLLGLHPKDFDVATNATPEETRKLFRRSRIVGRRFRIAHVRIGREVVEVTTFRAHHDGGNNGGDNGDALRSEQGLLLRDNVFGDIHEDANRRDFTVNALYYSPSKNDILDYTGGVEDIRKRRLRIIGDPGTRYREDPVRMLRALRFAAKLGFTIAPESARPIQALGSLLEDIAPARLFDEILKLFMSGHGLAVYHLLQEYDLFRHLFPESAAAIRDSSTGDRSADSATAERGFFDAFVEQSLANTDQRIRNDKPVTPAFLFAALLWPAVCARSEELKRQGGSPLYSLQTAAGEVISRQTQRISIPRRFSMPMREIWEMQLRLLRRNGKQALRLLEHPRFRAAYDFTLLREEAGEDLQGLGLWWTRFQESDPAHRNTMIAEQQSAEGKPGRRRRRRRRRTPGNPSQQ